MNDTDLKSLIARNPNHPKHGVPVPLILICNVSGKETKYTAPEYIAGKIKATGSLEALLKAYVSKGAGKNAAGATKAPSSRQWKGKDIIIKKGDEAPTPTEHSIAATAPDTVHREFQMDHGHTCHVYHQRQNPDQASEIVHDHRKKTVAPQQ